MTVSKHLPRDTALLAERGKLLAAGNESAPEPEVGKKSRAKRERRDAPPRQDGRSKPPGESARANFDALWRAIKGLLGRHRAAEVAVALGVSELWLPNRSSALRHALAMRACLSMAPAEFTGALPLATYEAFGSFMKELIALLPRTPMLEDFVPEGDWGEIRVPSEGGDFQPAFYGGSVERVPDFIEAFRLLAAEELQALADMDLALAIQSTLIEAIGAGSAGPSGPIEPGLIEVPSAAFWESCSEALRRAGSRNSDRVARASSALICEPGAVEAPKSMSAFGDAFMSGTALPHLFYRTPEFLTPISPREASGAIVELWSSRIAASGVAALAPLARRMGRWLAERFHPEELFAGPIMMVGESGRLGTPFAAVLRSAERFHLILPVDDRGVEGLARLEQDLAALVGSGQRWGLALMDERRTIEFRGEGDGTVGTESIELVAVMARVTTVASVMRLPETRARVIALPDFITICDSLRDGEELERFWTYLDEHSEVAFGLAGMADHFAAFRDSHGLLLSGADTPNFIGMDPHWGSRWRFERLRDFWATAPRFFPDGRTTWLAEPAGAGLTLMRAKGAHMVAWSAEVGACITQCAMEADLSDPDLQSGRAVELFAHCAADSLARRGALLSALAPFGAEHIVINCLLGKRVVASAEGEAQYAGAAALPLLSEWRLAAEPAPGRLRVSAEVNAARVRARLENAPDASFEAECAIEIATGLCRLLGAPLKESLLAGLRATAAEPPRFTLRTAPRSVDVPDHAAPVMPGPEHFKLARRDLAVVFKSQGVSAPARYELDDAKRVINAARDTTRARLHERISAFDREALLRECVKRHDEVLSRYQHEILRLRLSLTHEVAYDRAERLAELREKHDSGARNCRYLLESCLSSESAGSARPSAEDVLRVLASVDWLLVLYGASDTLHNQIDVGGIELDCSYVPTIFFSRERGDQGREFSRRIAEDALGIGLSEEDEVTSKPRAEGDRQRLDAAFEADLGCSLSRLLQALTILCAWHAVGGDEQLRFQYATTPEALACKIMERFPETSAESVAKAIAFLTLDPAGVRRLAGKLGPESDVPVWEHFKRAHRYLIRPLVPVAGGMLIWGAATAERAQSIWAGSLDNGYLPADFPWPSVARESRRIKKRLEDGLEERALEICARHAPHAARGIDFRRRSRSDECDDVGDFDTLAYWPDRNLWLIVECKYNQPPYCLKDARRLRDNVFGVGEDHGQFAKIERRIKFFKDRAERLRALLGWPVSSASIQPKIRAVYLSRAISWFLVHPPYPVPTEFVTVDALDKWIQGMLEPSTSAKAPG